MNEGPARAADVERPAERYEGEDPLFPILAKWEAEDLREQLDETRDQLERLKSDTRTTRHAAGIIMRWLVPASLYAAVRSLSKR